MTELEQSYEKLSSLVDSLSREVARALPRIQRALDPRSTLPEGYPSHAALAQREFRQVVKKLHQVSGAIEVVQSTLAKRGM